MKTLLITQARMTSTRLPGKVLLTAAGKSLLQIQIERLRLAKTIDEIVVATTTNATDDPIVALCEQLAVGVWRGAEDDVLSRFHGAAEHFGADAVMRVTSDCPLIDPGVVDQVVNFFNESQPLDYASNFIERTYPRGLDCEIFQRAALDAAFAEAATVGEREHVTLFLYRRPERFQLRNVANDTDYSRYRWTVDTPEDFELIRRILEALYPTQPAFTWHDVLALLERHPDWEQINAHVEHKPLN